MKHHIGTSTIPTKHTSTRRVDAGCRSAHTRINNDWLTFNNSCLLSHGSYNSTAIPTFFTEIFFTCWKVWNDGPLRPHRRRIELPPRFVWSAADRCKLFLPATALALHWRETGRQLWTLIPCCRRIVTAGFVSKLCVLSKTQKFRHCGDVEGN